VNPAITSLALAPAERIAAQGHYHIGLSHRIGANQRAGRSHKQHRQQEPEQRETRNEPECLS
jgi:hypothetical protein